jgi:large subunit ribosomal protein L18
VYRSLKSIYAQVVDDTSRKTLFGVSSLTKTLAEDIKKAKDKTSQARIVGKAIAEEAKKQNIEKVVFDRNGYLYHGRVKAVADGAREAGLKF